MLPREGGRREGGGREEGGREGNGSHVIGVPAPWVVDQEVLLKALEPDGEAEDAG
jgi:hypothetical protein